MATPNIVPRADSEGALGTATKYWGAAYIDLIYLGAGKIGRDADNLLDFSVDNKIKLRVEGVNEYEFLQNVFRPITTNGAGLGDASHMWSDLFLASGAVINFDNGNVTLTHSANALTLADSDKLNFGASSDLQIYHDGSDSIISDHGPGDLIIQQTSTDKDIIFKSDDGAGNETAYITLDGGETKINVFKKMEFQDNVELAIGSSEDLKIDHNATNSRITNYTGDLIFANTADDKDIIFQSDNGSGGTTAYLTLDGSHSKNISHVNMHFDDNVKIQLGSYASADLQIYHDGNFSRIDADGTGDLIISQKTADKDIIFISDNGAGGDAIYFYLDGSSATHDGSATTALFTNWPDNSKISLGTSHDLQILHNGTDSYIINATNDLHIVSTGDDVLIKAADDFLVQTQTNQNAIFAGGNGSVDLYHNNAKKFETTATGALVTGFIGVTVGVDVTGGNIDLVDNSKIRIGTSQDLRIYHDASNSFIENYTGDLKIINYADDKDIIFFGDDGGGNTITALTLDMSDAGTAIFNHDVSVKDSGQLRAGNGGDVYLLHDATNSYLQNETGDLYIQNGANGKDIILRSDDGSGGQTAYLTLDGSATKVSIHKEVDFGSHINLIDNANLNFGAGNDLAIYHDGSNSYIAETGTGLLNIFSNGSGISLLKSTGENMGLFKTDGAVELYHDNAKKFETTATGIAVTGGITVTGDSSVFTSANANDPVVEIKNTTNDNDAARLQFTKDRGAAAEAGDNIAQIDFVGENTAQETILYSRWVIDNEVAADGQEGGKVQLLVATHDAELQVGLDIRDGNAEDEVDVTIANGVGSLTTVAGDLTVTGDVVMMPNLPTSDPSNAGQLWSNSGVVTVSAG